MSGYFKRVISESRRAVGQFTAAPPLAMPQRVNRTSVPAAKEHRVSPTTTEVIHPAQTPAVSQETQALVSDNPAPSKNDSLNHQRVTSKSTVSQTPFAEQRHQTALKPAHAPIVRKKIHTHSAKAPLNNKHASDVTATHTSNSESETLAYINKQSAPLLIKRKLSSANSQASVDELASQEKNQWIEATEELIEMESSEQTEQQSRQTLNATEFKTKPFSTESQPPVKTESQSSGVHIGEINIEIIEPPKPKVKETIKTVATSSSESRQLLRGL